MASRATGHSMGGATRGRRRLYRAAGVVLLLALALGAYLVGGFLRFAQEVAALRPPASISDADGIVVLTGGTQRLDQAMRLLEQGEGQRLLISGVNPGTGPASLQRLTQADPALFECCVDLDYAALDTVGNAAMTVRWARENGLQRIVLVTSDYHIPRSLIEIADFDNAPEVVPYPVSPDKLWHANGTPSRLGLRLLVSEYTKVLVTRARLALGLDYGLLRQRSPLGDD